MKSRRHPVPEALVYAYPWDFEGDGRAADRAASLGVRTVAIAANYHGTRAARPLHPARPLVQVKHAACYVPVRPAAWKGRRLVPGTPDWVDSEDSFGAARDAVERAGLATEAWVVLTHNSALGRDHPDLVVLNAFGDRYDYALCPSAPDVVEYCATLVDEIVASGPGDGLVLEACGPMGFDHNGAHEKTSLAGWSNAQRDLLSLCFCTACTARYRARGIDLDRLGQLVRRAVLTGSDIIEEMLGGELAQAVADVRTSVAAELRSMLAARIKQSNPKLRVTVHGSTDPWATGSFATLAPAVGDGVDTVIASCFAAEHGADGVAALHALSGTDGPSVGAIVRPSEDWSDEAVLRERLAAMHEAGMEELHLYHLGLVGEHGLGIMRRMVTAFLTARARRSEQR